MFRVDFLDARAAIRFSADIILRMYDRNKSDSKKSGGQRRAQYFVFRRMKN